MMKNTIVVCSLAFWALSSGSMALAQKTPAPPPVEGRVVPKKKSRTNIPPAPAISALRSHSKRAGIAKAMGANHVPGEDLSHRMDLSGKPNGFYPVSKATTVADARKQTSAVKTNTKRVAKQEFSPKPTPSPH
jgi:hypothetical protein